MAKIVEGVALVAAAVGLAFIPGLQGVSAWLGVQAAGLWAIGISGGLMLTQGIVDQVRGGGAAPAVNGQSQTVSIKQAAANRQIVYGQVRVNGVVVYESSTNSDHDVNQVVVWSGMGGEVPQLAGIDSIYLDGRKVIPSSGTCDSADHQDDSGNTYNLKGLVYCENSTGGAEGHYFASLGAVDSKWSSDCLGKGIAMSYIKYTLDSTVFQGLPAIVAVVRGKHVYDPRINGVGYTNNATLVIADVMMSAEYGLGIPHDEMDWDYIAGAANVCDEEIILAAGGTEARYTINGFCDTSQDSGTIIQSMLDSMGGQIGQENGKWRIYPGAYYGTGLVFFDDNMVQTSIKWSPNRSRRDRINAMRASFVSPRYPYTRIIDSDVTPIQTADQDVKDDTVFTGQWQATDAPEYAQDALHGYESDANLAKDGGVKLYGSLNLRWCTSVCQAQRVMKQALLKNIFGGTGTLTMDMSAYQLVAGDVAEFTFSKLGWNEKTLEVQSLRFVPGADSSGSNQDAPAIYCELQVAESDPSIYEWSAAEELGIENTQSPVVANAWDVNPPNNLLMESGIDSAVVGIDGITVPRIQIFWDPPEDPFTQSGGYVELQTQQNGSAYWISAGFFEATTTSYFLTGVVCGQQYNCRMRSVRNSGASSGWVDAGPHTVSTTVSSISHENISGLGALATRNSVDFASGSDILNRTADHINYTAGLTVDQLRPAEVGSERTTGKSLTILTDRHLDNIADSATYARVKGNQVIQGAVTGRSAGTNMLGNPSFESNLVGTTFNSVLTTSGQAVGDEWTVWTCASGFHADLEFDGSARTGGANLLIRTIPGLLLVSGAECRVVSTKQPVLGGISLWGGGWVNATSSLPLPSGFSFVVRITAVVFDIVGSFISEYLVTQYSFVGDGVTVIGTGYQKHEFTMTTPGNVGFIQMCCAIFQVGAGGTTPASGLLCDARFDDLWLVQQSTTEHYVPHSISANYSAFIPTFFVGNGADGNIMSIQAANSGSLEYTYQVSIGGVIGPQGGALYFTAVVNVNGGDVQAYVIPSGAVSGTTIPLTIPVTSFQIAGDPLITIRIFNQSGAAVTGTGYMNVTALKA